MDGKALLRRLRYVINEVIGSAFLDDRLSYELLWEAAQEYVRRTRCITGSCTITTVADQTNYDLEPDFIELYQRDKNGNFFIPYNDGSNTTTITWTSYENIIHANNTTSVSIPSNFCIIDKSSLPSQVTGTATSDGDASGGQCTLTDTSATFQTSLVSPGDTIHNTTDGSDGYVISVTDETHLVVALWGGTDNEWDTSDAYVIQPQPRLQIRLDPPPSTAGHTGTIYYIARPEPVFSDYGVYRIPEKVHNALVFYAAHLYADRDHESQYSKYFLEKWDVAVRMGVYDTLKTFKRPVKWVVRR